MEIKKLKNNLESIIKKYEKDKSNIKDYLDELYDAFYEFADNTGNYDFEHNFGNIISGEDCIGLVSYADIDSFYYWKSSREVSNIDYDLLTKITKETISEIENNKDFDIC